MSGRFATIQSQVYKIWLPLLEWHERPNLWASSRFLSAKFSKPSCDLPLSNHKMNHPIPFLHARHALCRSCVAWYKMKVDNGSMVYIYIWSIHTYILYTFILDHLSIYTYILYHICTYTLVDMYVYRIHIQLHPTKGITPRATTKRLQNQ